MSNKTALIVDDEVEIRDLLSSMLTKLGFKTDTAENGDIALKMLRKNNYDLLILDNQMPVMTGEALLNTYSSEKPHDQKIIFCTGKSLSLIKMVEENHFFVCIDSLLNKPFNVEKLTQAIEELF